MFPREDIQRGLCHCPVEEGTAVTILAAQTVRWCVLAILLCGELLMEWNDF